MMQELIALNAKYYADRYTAAEIQNFIDNSTDVADIKGLEIALNIQNEVYGKQLALEF